MTPEIIQKYFKTSLGQQCSSLFSTPDDRVFIRYDEARQHCIDNKLNFYNIYEWVEEFSGSDSEPKVRGWETAVLPTKKQCFEAISTAMIQLMKDHPEFQEEYSTGWDLLNTLDYIKQSYQ